MDWHYESFSTKLRTESIACCCWSDPMPRETVLVMAAIGGGGGVVKPLALSNANTAVRVVVVDRNRSGGQY